MVALPLARPRTRALTSAVASLVLLSACADETSDTPAPTPTPESRTFSIPVRALLGGDDFSCAGPIANVGRTGATVTPLDLRVFLYGFETRDASGAWTPLVVEDVAGWQSAGVALLDFASPETGCPNAGAGLRTQVDVRGDVDALDGLRFRVGLPFELNHANPAEAQAPLSLTAMHWSWQAGYKFIRLDVDSAEGSAWRLHLGSTGCEGSMTNVTGCAAENRVTIELADASEAGLVLDLDALLADVDVEFNTEGTAPGCMSSPDDPECDPVFAALGLGASSGLDPVLFRTP